MDKKFGNSDDEVVLSKEKRIINSVNWHQPFIIKSLKTDFALFPFGFKLLRLFSSFQTSGG